MRDKDRPVHDWYRFVLSYPPHFVRDYLKRFGIGDGCTVLDPFCGTGTTLVECKKLGVESIGLEANPLPCFASRVKVNWSANPSELVSHARKVGDIALTEIRYSAPRHRADLELVCDRPDLRTLDPEQMKLLLSNSISPLPLHKTLILLDCLNREIDDRFHDHERLALANALVRKIGNLHFGPEVGVGKPKSDVGVVEEWFLEVLRIARDLRAWQEAAGVRSTVHCADARDVAKALEPASVDAVITSPPYPNEKDYTRTTRLESVLLGFIHSKDQLRALKRRLVRSNTRGVYKEDDDEQWVATHREIQDIAEEIESRRIAMGKTSGFERRYARVTRLYFGGMARHLADLRAVLKPGAQLAYVVGDQASYLQVMIRTGQLLADIAQSLGYEVVAVDLFRTRLATATRQMLREEVVVLRWSGDRSDEES